EDAACELFPGRAGDRDACHVRDIEHAGGSSHRAHLFEDAPIHDGHFVASELNHACPEVKVSLMERRLLQGFLEETFARATLESHADGSSAAHVRFGWFSQALLFAGRGRSATAEGCSASRALAQ